MAIKIDLLPATVGLRRNLNRTLLLSACVLGLSLGALMLVYDAKQKELATAQEDQQTFEAVAAKTTAEIAKKTQADSDAKAVTDTVGFMLAAGKTGPQRAALVNQVRQYIYEGTVVTGIDVSDGQNAKINATVKNPDEYATFLLNLRRASFVNGGPLFEVLPRAGGVKGFNNGAVEFVPPPAPTDQPVVIVYPLKIAAEGKLKYPVVLPPDPVGAAPAAGGQPGAPPAGTP